MRLSLDGEKDGEERWEREKGKGREREREGNVKKERKR